VTYLVGLALAWALGFICGYQYRMIRRALVAAG
jgi:hypothetical protein